MASSYFRYSGGRARPLQARSHRAMVRALMATPWITSCSCGWVAAAETFDEASQSDDA